MRSILKRTLAAVLTCAMLLTGMTLPLGAEDAPIQETVTETVVAESATDMNDKTETPLLDDSEDGIKDENGKLLVPFDMAYPEAFDSGEFPYDTSALLIKTSETFDGILTAGLVGCGVASLEEICRVADGVWYRAVLADRADIGEAMTQLRALDEVLMADYDYQVESESVEVAQAATYEAIAAASETWWNDAAAQNPRISEQWYLNSCHIQETWDALEADGINPGGASSVIVAVIDTGVDYTHPDLASSMWVNPYEIPGNGIDDDGNGYKDDIHGVSTVGSTYDHKGDPMDDHGHGTHVAGIIGAANNKEGIVGIAYNVKIMAVKAGQATGVFNQSDIAEAIMYAYENGAEVINMSFGSAACSIAVQEALEMAWSRAVLVASAGNDGNPNEETVEYGALPNYPAAFNFVLGVMSVNMLGIESSFTNWDVTAQNSAEYEVYAPGEAILSTLPNGKYGYLSGTSMAAPVVSAIAALLRSQYTDRDMYPAKFIDGQICATSENYSTCVCSNHVTPSGKPHNVQMIVDAYAALTKLPKPDLYIYDTRIFDDVSISSKNNGDGFIDSGETIHIAPILYNQWGMSKDTVITIDSIGSLGMENPYVEIITASSNYEGVGTYSTKDQFLRDDNGIVIGAEEPLIVRIKDDCPNDYLIQLNVTITCKNGLDASDTNTYVKTRICISFWVRNGAKFPNVIDTDTVITNDKYYILDGTCTILKDVTLTIEAGTQIQMNQSSSIRCFGTLDAQGAESNAIQFIGEKGNTLPRYISKIGYEAEIFFNYTTFDGRFEIGCTELNHCNCLLEYRSPSLSNYNDSVVADKIRYSYIEYADILASTIEKSTIYRSEVKAYLAKDCTIVGCQYGIIRDNYVVVESYRGSYCVNWTEGCTLYDTEINTNAELRQCAIMGSASNENDIYCEWSPSDPRYQKAYVSGFVQNDSTNTTYIRICDAAQNAIYLNDSEIIKTIQEALGGAVACIETPEEYDFLWENNMNGFYGLKYDSNCWMNGTSVGDWLFVEQGGLQYTTYVSLYNLHRHDATVSDFALEERVEGKKYLLYGFLEKNNGYPDMPYGHGLVFEIVNTDITKEKAQEIVDACMKTQKNNLYDCAIINDFLKPAGNVVMRARAQSNYEECKTYNVSGIYWGTTDLDLIEAQILDFDDEPYERDQIDPTGFLTEAPSDTMPFVTDAYLLNQDGERVRTVNNETVTFVVEFNRDMDTSVPLSVTFGSSAETFYADYDISEHGKFVTPRRWEATYTLKTVIENGNHTIKIENGQAADDEWLKLYDVPGRFMFEIDTTAAQALIMQGQATEQGINLTWTQDDFDTLFGYNVYRATSENGTYQRMNKTVIPHDTKEFLDTTVDSCKVYYYNFTVVKTDLTESDPSGKISLMSLDTEAPKIQHTPVQKIQAGNNLMIAANVTDNLAVREVRLWYRVAGTSDWKSTVMNGLNGRYTGMISANYLKAAGLEYYIDAGDGVNLTKMGSADAPYHVVVEGAEPEPTPTFTPGDLNEDGVINTSDVVLLRRYIAGGYGVTIDEKAADVNADGVLNTSDVVLIRRYIAGGYGVELKTAS